MRLRIDVDMGNAAFEHAPAGELLKVIGRMPSAAIHAVELKRPDEGKLRDSNGNTVGKWSVMPPSGGSFRRYRLVRFSHDGNPSNPRPFKCIGWQEVGGIDVGDEFTQQVGEVLVDAFREDGIAVEVEEQWSRPVKAGRSRRKA